MGQNISSNTPIQLFLFFFEKLQEYLYYIARKLKQTTWIPQFPSVSPIQLPNIHLLHIYIIIISIIICIMAYIKIKYPFWNIQPVYHTYDFWRYFYKNSFQVQRNTKHINTKFTQKEKVKTVKYIDASSSAKKKFIDKLQCYYLLSEELMFIINPIQLDTIMNGHIHGPAFISFYLDTIYSTDTQLSPSHNHYHDHDHTITPKETKDEFHIKKEELPVAGMVSYPITLKYKNKQLISHYWDYIWVNRAYQNKNIQRILIQTHDARVREITPDIQTSIFKKTNTICQGIVPIVKYKTYLLKTAYQKCEFPKNTFLTRIYNQYNTLYDILNNENLNQMFDLQLLPDLSHIQTLIKKEQLYVYCLKQKNQIISIYFFKETFSLCEFNNTRILQLVSSICNSRNTYIHIVGYMYSIRNILKHVSTKYGVIAIDDLAHNDIIIKYLNFSKENATENAFYTYNYVIPKTPLNPQRALVIL